MSSMKHVGCREWVVYHHAFAFGFQQAALEQLDSSLNGAGKLHVSSSFAPTTFYQGFGICRVWVTASGVVCS